MNPPSKNGKNDGERVSFLWLSFRVYAFVCLIQEKNRLFAYFSLMVHKQAQKNRRWFAGLKISSQNNAFGVPNAPGREVRR